MLDGKQLLDFIEEYNLWDGEFTLINPPYLSIKVKQTHLKDLLPCIV